MTNITREQIEDFTTFAKNAVIKAAVVTGKDYKPYLIRVATICDLALRALDTPSVEEIEAKAYEQGANFHSQVSINLRRNGKMELAEDLELFTRTLRNVNLLNIRYVELPEGHVVVPVNPTEAMWGSDLVRLLMVWCEGPKITPRSLIEAAKFRGIQLPEWLLKEKEMDALDHTVSKGTRATLIYRAMIGEVK